MAVFEVVDNPFHIEDEHAAPQYLILEDQDIFVPTNSALGCYKCSMSMTTSMRHTRRPHYVILVKLMELFKHVKWLQDEIVHFVKKKALQVWYQQVATREKESHS